MLSTKKLLYKILDYLDKRKLQDKTVTATTNAYGALNLNLANGTYYVCQVRVTSNNSYRAIPVYIGASTYAIILNDAATYAPIANTSVTVKIYYREII